MLPFEVRRFTGRSNCEVAVLMDRQTGPVFWPNVFVTSQYLQTAKSANTSARVLRSIGMARMWASACGHDLDYDLSNGNLISVQEAESLAGFLRLSAVGQEKWVEKRTRTQTDQAKVISLERVRPDHRALATQQIEASDPSAAAASTHWVASYIEWHISQRLGKLDRQRRESADIKTVGAAVVSRLRSLVPRSSTNNDDEMALEGVDRDVVLLIEQSIQPYIEQNPFQSGFVQARNYLLWRLLIDTGARRAEIRNAKVAHIIYAQRRFEIHKSKTIPRTVPINHKTAEAFDGFVESYWSQLPKQARRRESRRRLYPYSISGFFQK
jgi:site-specific recombinase XerD